MKNKLKLTIVVLVSLGIITLIRFNVTATKETNIKQGVSTLALEVNSDIVSKVTAKLTLLDDKIGSDVYKNLYFDFEEKEKMLSIEDKMYIVFESLYEKDALEEEVLDDGEIVYRTTPAVIKEEALSIFKEEDFNFIDANFVPSKECGIVDYLYTGQNFEFKIKKCDNKNDITKSKIVGALKDGNLIELKLKAIHAIVDKKDKTKYSIKNFREDDVLDKIDIKEIDGNDEELFKNSKIDEYIFSFELRGDEYYLTKIKRDI